MGLAQIVLDHVSGGNAHDVAAIEAAVQTALRTARAAWPDLHIPAETFVRHLAERLPPGGDPIASLASLHAADLYLALGCTRGTEHAIKAFEGHFMARVPEFLAGSRQRGIPADEVQQAVRDRVLVADGRDRPRIADYSGSGPLLAWLRVTTARVAVNLRASRPRDLPLPSEVAGVGADPELAYLKAHHRGDFEAAFAASLADLPARDATVLKLHFVNGMSAAAIGRSRGVNERNVQRWIADARQRILDATHRRMAEQLRLSVSQLPALTDLLRSQADVSVARILAAGARRKPS